MNILAATQQAISEIGLAAPTALIGATDQGTIQMLAIAQASASTLAADFDWQALTKVTSFNIQSYSGTGATTLNSNVVTLTAPPGITIDTTWQVSGVGVPQGTYVLTVVGSTVTLNQNATATGSGVALTFGKTKYTLPSDYLRMVNRTQYDKSRRWALAGPATAQEWEWLQSSYISTGPRIRYRVFSGYLQTWPVIATNDLISYEYISNGYAIDFSTGLPKTTFTADTDTYVWPDRLMQVAIKYRYLAQRGLDATGAYDDFMRLFGIAEATDAGAATLSMGGAPGALLINMQNIPDSGYGLT